MLGLKVAIDVDGVLANFHEAAARIINLLRPGAILDPVNYAPPERDFWKLFGVSNREFWDRVDATHNFWLHMPAYYDNVAALYRFVHSGAHIVTLCTARHETVGMTPERQTHAWLELCGYIPSPYGYLSVVVVSKASSKRYVYQAMGISYSVDDRPDTIEECNSIPDHKAYLLSASENRDSLVKPRVETLQEFFDKIQGKL